MISSPGLSSASAMTNIACCAAGGDDDLVRRVVGPAVVADVVARSPRAAAACRAGGCSASRRSASASWPASHDVGGRVEVGVAAPERDHVRQPVGDVEHLRDEMLLGQLDPLGQREGLGEGGGREGRQGGFDRRLRGGVAPFIGSPARPDQGRRARHRPPRSPWPLGGRCSGRRPSTSISATRFGWWPNTRLAGGRTCGPQLEPCARGRTCPVPRAGLGPRARDASGVSIERGAIMPR